MLTYNTNTLFPYATLISDSNNTPTTYKETTPYKRFKKGEDTQHLLNVEQVKYRHDINLHCPQRDFYMTLVE
jgi:hypothetical protein